VANGWGYVLGALAALAVTSACDAGSPASPTLDAGGPSGASGMDAGGAAIDATMSEAAPVITGGVGPLCPDAMSASFESIFSQMLSTGGCGTGRSFDCHSSTGALPAAEGGTGSLLDFSLDAATVYEELLGTDGGGQPAVNVDGDAGGVLLRVAPGDAGASLLYIKLALPTAFDPVYGKAMPPTQVVCPSALDAVKAWIDNGAAAR
jgi:hypothetical protein